MSNNRLKFRVWGVDYGQYMPENQFVITQDGELRHFASGLDVPQTSFIIEQSTGITDKNGKLIYDGDILRATCTDGKNIDYPVGWWDGAFHLYYVDKSLIAETGTIQFCLRGLVSVKNCCYREIIGNIHDDQFRDATKMVEDSVCE